MGQRKRELSKLWTEQLPWKCLLAARVRPLRSWLRGQGRCTCPQLLGASPRPLAPLFQSQTEKLKAWRFHLF